MGSSESGELHRLLEDGVVEEIVGRLKTGKEAEVWLVSHAGEIVAAKVYKDSAHRSFHNRSGYQEGRQVRNSRTRRAMEKGSRFGRAAEEDAWKSTEADALYKLHALGVRVPKPVMFYEGVLLMEAVIDPEGHPAPRLMDAPIPPEQALALYKDLRSQVIRMLCADVIHGDLSPYNVLLAWNGPTVIDFPQVVGAAGNSRAEMYFKRDLDNLRTFFTGFDRAVGQLSGDGHEIWRAYTRRELTPDFEPTGRAPVEPPRPAGAPAAASSTGGLARREYRPGDDRQRRPQGGRPQGGGQHGGRGNPNGGRPPGHRHGGPPRHGAPAKGHGNAPLAGPSPQGGHFAGGKERGQAGAPPRHAQGNPQARREHGGRPHGTGDHRGQPHASGEHGGQPRGDRGDRGQPRGGGEQRGQAHSNGEHGRQHRGGGEQRGQAHRNGEHGGQHRGGGEQRGQAHRNGEHGGQHRGGGEHGGRPHRHGPGGRPQGGGGHSGGHGGQGGHRDPGSQGGSGPAT